MNSTPRQMPWPLIDRDLPDLAATTTPVECGPVAFSDLSEGPVLWTVDDTEQRLLSETPAALQFLVACGPWTIGCTLPSGALPMSHASTSIGWRHNGVAVVRRPELAPRSQALPGWIASAFQRWGQQVPVKSSVELTALEAGLRQVHDDLDGSHQCAQSIEGAGCHHGDYWHAIMHRREPDYGNSQYWSRRVGRHAIFPHLAEEAPRVAKSYPDERFARWLPRLVNGAAWNPMAFVDCAAEAAGSSDPPFRRAVEELQYREMLLLFAQTFRDAVV